MLYRRDFAFGIGATAVAGQGLLRVPDPVTPTADSLQSGDYLWPKPPGSWVPNGPTSWSYLQTPSGQAMLDEEVRWEQQRDRFVSGYGVRPPTGGQIQTLGPMGYDEFALRFYGGRPNLPAFYVGHVAIVDAPADGPAMVIEAVPDRIRRISYADWVAEHVRDHVFHGRLKGAPADGRTRIADIARTHVGVRYDFFDFNMNSVRGFYCSKLAWLATRQATGIVLDGDPNPNRVGWFAPGTMFYCPTIEHLNSAGQPGDYAPA